MKISLDDDLLLKKTLESNGMIIFFRSDFHEGSKSYPQIVLDECL